MTRIAKLVGLVALLGLCLTGGATAASKITGSSVKDSSLTTKDIKDRSLLARDFRGGQLPSGPQGPVGPAGPAGPGLSGFTTVESVSIDLLPGHITTVAFNAYCPAGTRVLGTGFYNSIATVGFVKSYGTFVGGVFFNETGVTANDVHLQAICAAVPAGAVAARSAVSARREFDRDRSRAIAAAGK
jgi:hypothetical protein